MSAMTTCISTGHPETRRRSGGTPPERGAATPAGRRGRHCLVRYTGPLPGALRGPRTGSLYRFTASARTALIDTDDLDALRHTRLLVREPAPRSESG
jgi:hypothetical protein